MSVTPEEIETVRQYLDSVGKRIMINIALLGQNGVGKDSILIRLAHGGWKLDMPYDPTLEDSFRWTRHLEDKLIVFDGQPIVGNMDSSSTAYPYNTIRACEACFLIYDVTSRASFEYLRRCHHNISLKRSHQRSHSFRGVFFVVANKIDRDKGDWAVSIKEAEEFSALINAVFLPMSAKTEEGLRPDMLHDVARRIFLRRIQTRSDEEAQSAVDGRSRPRPGPLDGVLMGSFWSDVRRREEES